MNKADVGYMYLLVAWKGVLHTVGAPISMSEAELLDKQDLLGGVIVCEAETYEDICKMRNHLIAREETIDQFGRLVIKDAEVVYEEVTLWQ